MEKFGGKVEAKGLTRDGNVRWNALIAHRSPSISDSGCAHLTESAHCNRYADERISSQHNIHCWSFVTMTRHELTLGTIDRACRATFGVVMCFALR